MAERRMFAKSIVLSDAFLDMPMSARCLYFTLGMLADDDGFVGSPKSIMRQCGATNDDLKILLAKRYLLGFESGVIVIKHWRINNILRNDRYHNTTYLEELETLTLDGKGSYTERDDGQPSIEFEVVKEKKPLTEAQKKRLQARNESELPSSFDYKIRSAFVGKRCPICGCVMGYDNALVKPTIQHNLPISLGGKHELSNISVICQSCNTSIQNRKETPPYNTKEVIEIWERIGNGTGMETEIRLGKDSLDKYESSSSKNTELLNKNINDSCKLAQSPSAPDPKKGSEAPPPTDAVITIISNLGEEVPIFENIVKQWEKAYPSVNVRQELQKIKSWAMSNPSKRKTRRGMTAFVNRWLQDEQDKGRRTPSSSQFRPAVFADGSDREKYKTGETIASLLRKQEAERNAR